MVCAYNDDIEKITITAELHDDSFNFILCNTKNIFHPTMVIEADCEPGYQKEQLFSFKGDFLAMASLVKMYRRKNNLFNTFIGLFIGAFFYEMVLYEHRNNFV